MPDTTQLESHINRQMKLVITQLGHSLAPEADPFAQASLALETLAVDLAVPVDNISMLDMADHFQEYQFQQQCFGSRQLRPAELTELTRQACEKRRALPLSERLEHYDRMIHTIGERQSRGDSGKGIKGRF